MSDEQVYHLVFTESSSYFFSRFLKPGFRHVYAFQETMGDWILIDPSLNSLNVLALHQAKGLDLLKAHSTLRPNDTILSVCAGSPFQMSVFRLGPISCVSGIQYLLGIYWPLTLTPWGLYSRLLSETPPHIRIVNHGRI